MVVEVRVATLHYSNVLSRTKSRPILVPLSISINSDDVATCNHLESSHKGELEVLPMPTSTVSLRLKHSMVMEGGEMVGGGGWSAWRFE